MFAARVALTLGMLSGVNAAALAQPGAFVQPAARQDLPVAQPNENRSPAGRMLGDTLVVRLFVSRVAWYIHTEQDPALTVLAFGEEDHAPSIPGPLVRVRAGTPMHVTVRNPLADSLIVHGFGPRGDGVADSLILPPGEQREVRFASGAAGTYFYWAALGSWRNRTIVGRRKEDTQLAGAFIVDPRDRPPIRDRVFVITHHVDTLTSEGLMFRDSYGVPAREFVAINGKSWPHTERLTYSVGDSIRWRILSVSATPHPMHLHGFYFRVDSRGNGSSDTDTVFASRERRMAVTELLAPGETMSMMWSPDRPGGWLFHCHLTIHAVLHPPLNDRRVLDPPEEHNHADPDKHALNGMNGLVLGTTVVGPATEPRVWRPKRRLRLFVQSDSSAADSARRFSYVLQRGDAEPAADSLEPGGSLILLTRGEPTTIEVVNRLSEPTAVHWHGIELQSYYDGVIGFGGSPQRTTPAIRPGGSFEVRLTPVRAGTFIYHTHFSEIRQQYGGLYGPLIVLEPGTQWNPQREFVFVVSDGARPKLFVNGALTPAPVTLKVGTTYRFRFVNISVDKPLLHVRLTSDTITTRATTPLRGDFLTWRLVAKDAWPTTGAFAAPKPSLQRVGEGETADIEFTPESVGDFTLQFLGFWDPIRNAMALLNLVRVRVSP